MKPAYMGGVRGYQSAVHRPGMGLSDMESRSRSARRPVVFTKSRAVTVSPLAVTPYRRRGLRTRAAFIASIATVAAVLAIVFVGSAQF